MCFIVRRFCTVRRSPECALGHTGVTVVFCGEMGPGLEKVGSWVRPNVRCLRKTFGPLGAMQRWPNLVARGITLFGARWEPKAQGGAGQEVARPGPGSSGLGTELTRGKMEENTVQVLNGPDLSWTY